jgi:hypothetical protein
MIPRIRPINTIAASVALLVCSGAHAFTGGAPEGFNASPASFGSSCIDCHASFPINSGPGSISILDLPTLYVPSQTYTLRVRVEDPDKVGAGFEFSVEDPAGAHLGQLIIADPVNTDTAGSATPIFLTHTSTGKDNSITDWAVMGNAAEFTVQWQAPPTDTGVIGFYAAGAAINDGTASSNDDVYTISEMRPAASLGDLNGDGAVDTADLGLLLSAFGSTDPVADINNDGIVDTADLGLLLGVFGT